MSKFVRLRVAFGGHKSSFAFCMMSFLPLDLLDGRRDGEGRHRRCIALEAGRRPPGLSSGLTRSLLVRARGGPRLFLAHGGEMVRTPEPRGRAGYLERARVPLLLPLLAGGGAEVPVVPPPSAARSPPSPQSRSGRRGKRYFALLSEDC